MDTPLIGKEDPVKPALNAVRKDISNEYVPEKKNFPVPFTGETTGSLIVSSDESLQGQTFPEWLSKSIEGRPKCPQIASILQTDISKLEPQITVKVEEMPINFLLNRGAKYSVLLSNSEVLYPSNN
jgi:hypothetical protein